MMKMLTYLHNTHIMRIDTYLRNTIISKIKLLRLNNIIIENVGGFICQD